MIVWLASYPRSGSTLLRQVLERCFGLSSFEMPGYSEGVAPETEQAWQEVREISGIRLPTQSRVEFLAHGRASSEQVLIKTHEMPQEGDDSGAIYVVRDGRLALRSYVSYQKTYGWDSTFDELLLGDHVYQDWTTHYRRWRERHHGPLLLLRFEELVQGTPEVLRQLGDFLGHRGDVRTWQNPQDQLRSLAPTFFGPGSPTWTPDEFWTPTRLRNFYTLHGSLLVELGYETEAVVAAGAYPAGSEGRELLEFAWQAVRRCRQASGGQAAEIERLRAACDERLALLCRQAEEIERLRAACDERLKLLEEHSQLVPHLVRVCEEREEIIHRLQATPAPGLRRAA